MTVPTGPPTRGRFSHAALIVDSDEGVERLLVPQLRRHLGQGQPALVVVSPPTEVVIRDQLGADVEQLEWGRTGSFYQRLGLAYEGFRRYLVAQHAQGRTVYVVAEPDVRTDLDAPVDRVAAYLGYEAICNDVYAAYGCPVTCIWDARRHPTLVIEGVRSVHDHELTEHGPVPSTGYIPAATYLAGRSHVVMPPAPESVDLALAVSTFADLAAARATLQEWATTHGFSPAAAGEVASAANEVLTNALRHGHPPAQLRLWHHNRILVVQVDDPGASSIPADAGYRPPAEPFDPMGLWLARQLADVMIINTGDEVTSVRLYFPFAVTHRPVDLVGN